jgi:hypothetical protein
MGSVSNAIVNGGQNTGIPSFAPHAASYRMSKSEFVTNIYAPAVPGAFQNTVLPLNPGLQESFPWLGLVAPQFEEYEFLQMIWYWRPMVSDFNSGTGQVGEIIMVTQYNPSDAPFDDSLRAMSYDGAMSSKTSCSMLHGVECDPSRNSGAAGKYVRVGPLATYSASGQGGTDIKQYDLGNLNVIVTGCPPQYAGQLLGQLWCTYTIELRKPKLPDSTGDTILRDYFVSRPALLNGAYGTNTAYDIAALPLLYAQQNRINNPGKGLTVKQGPTDESCIFTYTIPAWYTGDMRLTFTLLDVFNGGLTSSATVNQYPRISASPFPLPPGVSYITDIRASPEGTAQVGSVMPVTSWIGTVPSSSDGSNYFGTAPAAPTLVDTLQPQSSRIGNLTCTWDIRVSSSTSGVVSTFTWSVYLPSAAAQGWTVGASAGGYTLDVTEYNTGFNASGSNIPLLQDISGNPVALP